MVYALAADRRHCLVNMWCDGPITNTRDLHMARVCHLNDPEICCTQDCIHTVNLHLLRVNLLVSIRHDMATVSQACMAAFQQNSFHDLRHGFA